VADATAVHAVPAVPSVVESGTFIVGTFEGITDEQYPKLCVRVSPTYVERLGFYEDNRKTGGKTIPEGLSVGDYVNVKVMQSAKLFTKEGRPAAFVAGLALDVEVLS
jgi:hypothetical protein